MKLLISLLTLLMAASVQGSVVYSGWEGVGNFVKANKDSVVIQNGNDSVTIYFDAIYIGTERVPVTLSDTGSFNETTGFSLAGGKTAAVLKLKGLLEGSNVTITKSGDSALSIAGPAGAGTADSMGVDTDGDGTVDSYLYSTTAGAFHLKEGTGMVLTVAGDTVTLATTLGTVIATGEITDGTILEADLNVTNAPAGLDNYVLSLNEGSNNFTWVAAGGTDSTLVAQYAHVSDSLDLAARLTGPTFTGDVHLDDGSGNSPYIGLRNEANKLVALTLLAANDRFDIYNNGGAISLSSNGDVDDYLKISTATNIVTLETVASGDGDLVIKSGGGDISFDDDLVAMKAWKWYTGGGTWGTYDSTDAPANGEQLTWNTGGTIDWQAAGGGAGEANTASDAGAGFQITHPKAGVDLPFKTFTGGNGITLDTNTANQLNFAFDGGASPAGELGGTWASPTIDDLFLRNTGDTVTTAGLHYKLDGVKFSFESDVQIYNSAWPSAGGYGVLSAGVGQLECWGGTFFFGPIGDALHFDKLDGLYLFNDTTRGAGNRFLDFDTGSANSGWKIATASHSDTAELDGSGNVITTTYVAKTDSGSWDEVSDKLIVNQVVIGNVSDSSVADSNASTRGYVEKIVKDTAALRLLLTGGALTGAVTTNSTFDTVDVATLAAKVHNEDLRHFIFALADPNALYDIDSIFCIKPVTEKAITVTRIDVTCNADPTTEPTMSLRFANNFISRTTPTTIDVITTTAGVTAITSGFDDATIPASNCIYFVFTADPEAALKSITVDITYTVD